jgi:hypothetical protein
MSKICQSDLFFAGNPLLVMATLARDVSVKRLYGIG